MDRRLSRKDKDLACMRQMGRCAYCEELLTDAMQTDHMNENRHDDTADNLACACGTCHANKTQHYRKKRTSELQAMLSNAKRNKARWANAWADDGCDHFEKLPDWLRGRVDKYHAHLYHIQQRNRIHPNDSPLNLELYRYKDTKSYL